MWGNRYVGKRVTGKENEKKWERKRKSGKWEFGTLGKWENGKWKVKRGKWENGKWKVESETWKVGKWIVESGKWKSG